MIRWTPCRGEAVACGQLLRPVAPPPLLLIGDRCLSCRQARDRHAVRAARDIVQADGVAEADTARLAAMLAANNNLQVRSGLAAALGPQANQLPDAILVEDRANLPAPAFDAIRSAIGEHSTMERALAWFFAQAPTLAPDDLIAQDEFSYDLLVPYRDRLYLSYDTS